jgi:uncharacterized damage-inducible protein DinB
MQLKHDFITQLVQEGHNTRRLLERLPFEKKEWKPHEKSMTLMELAIHIVDIPKWTCDTLTTAELDFSTAESKPYEISSLDELLLAFDKNINNALSELENASDDIFFDHWTLRDGDLIFFSLPKKEVLQTWSFNHWFHHRGQLTVYLRLLDVPVPGIYGASADEK